MCPACLAAISMVVAGVISTGGVTALVVKTIGRGSGGSKASGAGVHRGEENLQNLEAPKLEAKEKQQ
jgi:hypothetical protein